MKGFRKKRIQKRDNRGLSLVEMIVTIAIIAIFSGVVLTTVMFGTNVFRTTSGSARNQMSVQEIADRLEELILEANLSIVYGYSDGAGNITQRIAENDSGSTDDSLDKAFLVSSVNTAADGSMEGVTEVVEWDAEGQTLYYTRLSGPVTKTESDDEPENETDAADPSGEEEGDVGGGENQTSAAETNTADFVTGPTAKYDMSQLTVETARAPLAQNVTGFSLDVSRVMSSRIIEFEVTVASGGRELTSRNSVTLRNKVQIE